MVTRRAHLPGSTDETIPLTMDSTMEKNVKLHTDANYIHSFFTFIRISSKSSE